MTVIKVENLGKKYILTHKRKEPYTALRDVIAEKVRVAVRKVSSPLLSEKSNVTLDATLEEFWALQDVFFEVKEGESVGIIGRNGAGKSTLLKILSRITEPTSGRVGIKGRVASLLEVGTGFHPELTGRENIFLNGAVLGMTKAEIKKKFDEIVAFAEVEKFLDTPVKRYSSGMYVRLAFSVAAHLESEILIVDEVLAVGDAQFQKKCMGKMGDIGREGRTLLFVSHNMMAIQNLCTRAILLENGKNVKEGCTDLVIESYLVKQQNKEQCQDLYHMPRNGTFGESVRISSCVLYDSRGRVSENLKFGEPFSVKVECVGLQNLSGLQFVVGINSSLDQRICTIISQGDNRAFSISAGEKKSGVVKIGSLFLNPDRYSLTLGVRDSSSGHDHLIGIKQFRVEPIRHKSFFQDDTTFFGFVHVSDAEWTIS